jgi:hypothetical protein
VKTDTSGVPQNTGAVWVGGYGISLTSPNGGYVLNTGDSAVTWPSGVQQFAYDLAQIYIIAPNGGDGVQFIYGQ